MRILGFAIRLHFCALSMRSENHTDWRAVSLCYPPPASASPAGEIQRLQVCMNVKKRLLDAARMNRAIRRMAIEIVERNRGIDDLLIVGIRSRGVPIGERIAKEIGEMEGAPVS